MRTRGNIDGYPNCLLRSACLPVVLCLAVTAISASAFGQAAGTVGEAPQLAPLSILSDSENRMSLSSRQLICGDIAAQGTPIAGNAAGGGTSGSVTISGIPATATVVHAELDWTVLTNSDEASNRGQAISFDGNPVSGSKVGFVAGQTPCFPQANTFAWTADVTALVAAPGNGTYTVAGFPGSNNVGGDDFTEGVTLTILWQDNSAEPKTVVVYEGLTVTNASTLTLHQSLDAFVANAAGPVTAHWLPIIGNGQGNATEDLAFAGGAATLNFDNSLDGSTSEIPAGSCSYIDQGFNPECYWDDDLHDVSGAVANGDTSADVNYTLVSDCHSFVAMKLAVSVDDAGICDIGGQMVDAACPPNGVYSNHGDYVSCVAHAKEAALANLGCLDLDRLAEISSCIVNPRARSNVGKP